MKLSLVLISTAIILSACNTVHTDNGLLDSYVFNRDKAQYLVDELDKTDSENQILQRKF